MPEATLKIMTDLPSEFLTAYKDGNMSGPFVNLIGQK